jgi:hypothetical protein
MSSFGRGLRANDSQASRPIGIHWVITIHHTLLLALLLPLLLVVDAAGSGWWRDTCGAPAMFASQ